MAAPVKDCGASSAETGRSEAGGGADETGTHRPAPATELRHRMGARQAGCYHQLPCVCAHTKVRCWLSCPAGDRTALPSKSKDGGEGGACAQTPLHTQQGPV